MNKDENKKWVSASDCLSEQVMLDYIANKLTSAERNRVEKHLLECDFCSYAMEGMGLVRNRKPLDELDELISKRISAEPVAGKGKVIGMRFNYRIAAALALLVISGGILYFILSDTGKNEKMITQNFKPTKNTDTVPAATSLVTEEKTDLNAPVSKAEEKKTVAKPANTESLQLAGRKLEAHTAKARKEKQADKEVAAAIATQVKDTAGREGLALNNPIELGPVEVIGYKIPLIDKGNTTTQTTVTQEEIKNAPTKENEIPLKAQPMENEKIAYAPTTAAPSIARISPMADKKAKVNEEKSRESLSDEPGTPSRKTAANAQKDSSFSIAMKAYSEKQYSLAVQLFDDYLKKYPKDEKATFYDAVSNLSIDSAARALVQLDQLLSNENSPFYDDAIRYKAQALVKLHRDNEAKMLMKKVNKGK